MRRRSALDMRDRALLILAGVIVTTAMVCVTVLIVWSDAAGVAAGIGVFTGACTVAGAAVGRIGPARTVDAAPDPFSTPTPTLPDPAVVDDGDVFTTPEVP